MMNYICFKYRIANVSSRKNDEPPESLGCISGITSLLRPYRESKQCCCLLPGFLTLFLKTDFVTFKGLLLSILHTIP